LLELYGFLMITFHDERSPRALGPIGDEILKFAKQLASHVTGLDGRRVRVPPAWSLGAVEAETPHDDD
jgi:hypothetical protein